MLFRTCSALLGLSLLTLPALADETMEYKEATLVRQEDRGVLVFKLKDKDDEIKATPTLGMKGFDKDGTALPTAIPLKKDDRHSKQVLKIGNVLDIKIKQVNGRALYLEEARLVKGELLKLGEEKKEKSGSTTKKSPEDRAKAAEEAKARVEEGRAKAAKAREALDGSRKVYEKAKVRSYDERRKMLTVEAEHRQLLKLQITGTVKVHDADGSELTRDDRFRVFKAGNIVTITTTRPDSKELVSEVKLVEGKLVEKK